MSKPFVKYVGGKTQVLPQLLEVIPSEFESYHEPMVGGGALFWALARAGKLEGKRVVLSDINRPLIEAYQAVRSNPEGLIYSLHSLELRYRKEAPEALYYEMRDLWNQGLTESWRYIFLKQTSFNGLWRVNNKNKINIPWGHYENPKICDPDNIRSCSKLLKGVELCVGTWQQTTRAATEGALVYFDPPYVNRFDKYNSEPFTQAHHVELIQGCDKLTLAGAYVIYSNEQSEFIQEILDRYWTTAKVKAVGCRRYINSHGGGRKPVMDVIVRSTPKPRPAQLKLFSNP